MMETTYTSLEAIRIHQEKALQNHLDYLATNSPFYQDLFSSHQIRPVDIRTLADLTQIPVTTKRDLVTRNMDFLCVPAEHIIEYCSTSGTLGDPVLIALTENDLQRLALNELLSFQTAGITKQDIVHLMLSLDRQFMAGIAYHMGARQLGAGIIRIGPGNFAMQLQIIQRLKPTVLVAVPSFIVGLIGHSFEYNFRLEQTSVRKIICIGENLRNADLSLNALGERIARNWNVELYSTYASTEMQTAFTECGHGRGGHHQPDLLIYEVLDEHGNPVRPGEYGELTVTPLGIQGMPLLRYQTGDICCYFEEPCACGRVSTRLSPIKGRKNQMIKYKGTTLYPPSLLNALNSIELISDYTVEVFRNDMNLDDMIIHIAVGGEVDVCDPGIRQALQSRMRIVPTIRYTSMEEVQRLQISEGKRKPSKFLDARQ
ncbi:MAG: AMP-binding protein [Saprospiraceae bacterium]|nr:AMP-binding protein [Saprospiraceae bacterium]